MYECDCVEKKDQQLLWSADQCVCTTCARVVDAHPIVDGAEWFEDDQARCPALGRFDTYIQNSSGTLQSVVQPQPHAKATKRCQGQDPSKQLLDGLKDVENCAISIGISPDGTMASSAKEIYSDFVAEKKRLKKFLQMKRFKRDYAAVALYFGCKIHDQKCSRNPRSLREIAGTCEVSSKRCALIAKEYKSILRNVSYASQLFRTVTAEDLFMRALQSIPLKQKERCTILRVCNDIYSRINAVLTGRTPETICCICVYVACETSGLCVDRNVINNACAVSDATFKNAIAFLRQHDKNQTSNNQTSNNQTTA